jgi:putative endonuclease
MFYFYILRCKDGTLYCGSTNNLENRLKLHNTGRGSAYVKSRGGGDMVYSESFQTLGDAMRREIEVKKWSKAKKEKLLTSQTNKTKPFIC